ncbi:MAG: lysostaphin resistance A-like protein [Vicinamibacterales bacterium]
MTPLPPLSAATFAALTATLVAVWAPRVWPSPRAWSWWLLPFLVTLVLAQAGGLVTTAGLVTLFVLVGACRVAATVPHGALKGFALSVVLAVSAGILAHVLPGFENPRVLDAVRISPEAAPYTRYLNLDKGLLGLFLLTLVSPRQAIRRSRLPVAALVPPFVLAAAIVTIATLAAGYVRWDPKLPGWWPTWLWSMAFLTALPEEAVFRHLVQGGLQTWLGTSTRAHWTAIAASGLLFGAAHAGGGWTYVALATLAGAGYGWIYALSGSLTASIAAHAALNLLHFTCFTYPALASAVPGA